MHRVWKHLCLARRRDAWYALGRQRDSSPAGADVLAPTCVGVFFMPGYTGHKKDQISFEAGLAPSSSPAALYPLPCRILLAVETKQFCLVAPAIKRPDLIRGGPRPLELPRGAISASLPHPSGCRDQTILPGCTGHKKGPISCEAGLAPSCSPALYILLPRLDDRQQKEHSAEAECSSFGLFCFGWLVPNQAAFFALACAASALLPSTTRSMARMTSRMARIARM